MEDGIVVTEEMIDAGFMVLSSSGIADDYSGADRLLAEEIFRAMLAIQGTHQKSSDEKH